MPDMAPGAGGFTTTSMPAATMFATSTTTSAPGGIEDAGERGPSGGGGRLQEVQRVRSQFPEAWIWADMSTSPWYNNTDNNSD